MAMADRFLKLLDPNAERFTFTLFHDRKCGPPITLHDGIRDVWPCITAENSLGRGYGAFVTVNQTDFTGRKAENIIRARALFIDMDNADSVARAQAIIQETRVEPSMRVMSSAGRMHAYWLV